MNDLSLGTSNPQIAASSWSVKLWDALVMSRPQGPSLEGGWWAEGLD